MNNIELDKNGRISALCFGGKSIDFRDDCYGGPAFFVSDGERETEIMLAQKNENCFSAEHSGVEFEIKYELCDELKISLKLINKAAEIFKPERVFLRLGIDTYMDTYPRWNDKLFPTLLRCEKTHFYGYFMSPDEKILLLAAKDPIKSWKLDYNRWGDADNGHRIYTAELDLLSVLPQPQRHPEGFEMLMPGEEKSWELFFAECENVYGVKQKIHSITGAGFIEAEYYTLYGDQKPRLKLLTDNEYVINVFDPHGKKIFSCKDTDLSDCKFDEYGAYRIELVEKTIQSIYVYKRKLWSYYLDVARKQALLKPQKTTTHLEAWYGFFSAFLGRKYVSNTEYDEPLETQFDKILSGMYDMETAEPLTCPGRINNTGAAISLLCAAYEATGKMKYIDFASRLGDWLMKSQHTDGSYRSGYKELNGSDKNSIGVHYTAVVYPAKSMLELAVIEKRLGKEFDVWYKKYERHFNSAKRAIDDLEKHRDNIDTEGEMTFEDGMISCAALQLGMMALLTADENDRAKYTEAAEYLINKHQCLEQMIVPDCRVRNCSLRFWEAQYDVLYSANMMNSPHGWTSWKTYATYYLYLLTGKKDYLKRTFDSLSACMQVIDVENNDLRWAFICDPCVKTEVWTEDKSNPHNGLKHKTIVGEQYVDMISDWYTVKDSNPVGAYLTMMLETREGRFNVDNRGGCCDNDVHEHFKCLAEVALTSGYVYMSGDEVITYNCSCTKKDGVFVIKPYEDVVNKIHINSERKVSVSVMFADGYETGDTVLGMKWINSKKEEIK